MHYSREKTESLASSKFISGAGGLDVGFIRAGFTPVIGIDQDEAACNTYARNHPQVRVLKRDLSTVPKGYVIDRLA